MRHRLMLVLLAAMVIPSSAMAADQRTHVWILRVRPRTGIPALAFCWEIGDTEWVIPGSMAVRALTALPTRVVIRDLGDCRAIYSFMARDRGPGGGYTVSIGEGRTFRLTPGAGFSEGPYVAPSPGDRCPDLPDTSTSSVPAGVASASPAPGMLPVCALPGPNSTPTASPPTAEAIAGTWRRVTPAPHPGGSGFTMTWTGDELIVWGGAGGRRGAAWDPVTNAWRRTAPAPIPPRSGHAAVWTGSELIVWGGGSGRRDGAAYDPGSDSWRRLPRAPGPGRRNPAAVWTGGEMIVVGGAGSGEDPVSGIVYEPMTDAWRTLPPSDLPPGDEGGTHATVATWTGQEVVAVSYPAGPLALAVAAAYDPAADAWRSLGALPLAAIVEPEALWTGLEVLLVGPATGPSWRNDTPDGLGIPSSIALDPGLGCARETTYPADTSGVLDAPPVWSGRILLMFGLAYEPGADRWSSVQEPRRWELREFAGAVMAGPEYVIWGGNALGEAGAPVRDGLAFLPQDE